MGTAPPDAAYLGIKPIMIQTPKLFKGAHDDIERFIGDCLAYFEAFTSYFLHDSQFVTFAASLFDGAAKDWWIYKRPEFWAANAYPAQFRYPTWAEFVALVEERFRDPASEAIHE